MAEAKANDNNNNRGKVCAERAKASKACACHRRIVIHNIRASMTTDKISANLVVADLGCAVRNEARPPSTSLVSWVRENFEIFIDFLILQN